jgi:beta-xylosidase
MTEHAIARVALLAMVMAIGGLAHAQPGARRFAPDSTTATTHLFDIRMRDVCILPDPASQTYYMIGPGRGRGGSVRAYTSKDLTTWQGPQTIFRTPEDIWGDIPVQGIWAPELHHYRDKYYLFLTFNTRREFPEQWRDWLPRVYRGSQVLVADAPTGPYAPFQNRSTLPPDMMTLDGTLWVEDNVPYMVFCHEWVQIKDGTVEYIQLKDDLSETVGEPTRLFHGSDAKWSRKSDQYGCHVTDGPYLHTGKTGKLYMIWTSGGYTGYTTGIAISDSAKLAGPWRQQDEPLFGDDGGHGMLFTTFDGRLMMVLHAPNNRDAQPRIFQMEDTGETLRIVNEFTGIEP